jgi:ParB-like chromosome segregation protein Spo0J
MNNGYEWLSKKNLRSVDNLRLWGQNPRLDPDNSYNTVRDFAEEMTATNADRLSFIELAQSIVSIGFIPADPVVVWQNSENQKYYVAEGNRRVLALKLLRSPIKSPRSIRGIFLKLSKKINPNSIEKILVSIAPSLEDAEWYISQRNSTTSLQYKWASEQQRRWVADLYEKYNGDLDKIKLITNTSEAELQAVLRILKLKEFVKDLKKDLTPEEFKNANSHRFPLTTLERFFSFKDVRDEWGIEFDGFKVNINADHESFLKSYAILIKRMLLPRGDTDRIDSRTLRTAENAILIQQTLPQVEKIKTSPVQSTESLEADEKTNSEDENPPVVSTPDEREEDKRQKIKNNPNRLRLIPYFYIVETDSYRIQTLFDELKQVPIKYRNSIAASVRVLLDLAVLKYIETENIEGDIRRFYNMALRDITLKRRLEYLRQNISDGKPNNVIKKLLNEENEFSLDVLNGYVHNEDTHFMDYRFLNSFWDFLFPLLEKLIVIKEE